MSYTYKLDEKGIPYRVEERPGENVCPHSGLLSHNGRLKKFNLYFFNR